jgi:hypothetical protein
MKHLIITLLIAFYSTSALAQPECEFLSETIFTCEFDGETGLEFFEDLGRSQIVSVETIENGSMVVKVNRPILIGYDLDIDHCVSRVLNSRAKITCVLVSNEQLSGYSTARPTPNKYSTARPVPQKRVIRRVDAR